MCREYKDSIIDYFSEISEWAIIGVVAYICRHQCRIF